MIAALEAPGDVVRGEIFNVLQANYQIRELAMLVAGSVQLLGRGVRSRRCRRPRLTRDYECSNAKLSQKLGFIPCRSVVEAVSDMLAAIDLADRSDAHRPALLQHPLARADAELEPRIERFGAVL